MIFARFINENEIEYVTDTVQVTITNVKKLLNDNAPLNSVIGYYPVDFGKEPNYNDQEEYLQPIYSFDGEKIAVDYVVKELFI